MSQGSAGLGMLLAMKFSLALVCVLALASCTTPRPTAPHPSLGQIISLDLPSDTGKLVSVPWRGPRSYVLDFWGPSCKPCKEKLPALVARKQELARKGASLVLVAILDSDESSDQARQVLTSWGVNEPFLVSDVDASKSRAGVSSLPATLVLDASGRLLWSAPDNATDSDVINAVP